MPAAFLLPMIHLSPRLEAVARLVPEGARAIDVGTDHAMIPVWLVQTGRCSHVLATDIRSGPLDNAAALIERTGTGGAIRLLQTDGLAGIGPDEGDTVILAGMGGETMIHILSAAPWTAGKGILLILEPQSKRSDLRRWLISRGHKITSEQLAEDAGRVYPILTVQVGPSPAYSEAELHLGRLEQIAADPLFDRWLDALRAQAAKAAPFNSDAAALACEYDKIKERYCHGDSR